MYKPFFLNFREATTLVRSLEVAPGSYQLYLLCFHVHNEERGPWVCPLLSNVGEEEPRVPKEPSHIQSYLSWNSLVTSNWIWCGLLYFTVWGLLFLNILRTLWVPRVTCNINFLQNNIKLKSTKENE